MPKAVEDALAKAANRLASKGKLRRRAGDSLEEAKKRFIYGRMTNMQKAGQIPAWRKLNK